MAQPLSPPDSPWLSPREGRPARLSLGTMNFGKRTSAAESERIMARAVERGVVLLDTANVYNDGESERIVGKFLAGRRETVMVATKVGLARAGNRAEGLSRASILAAIDQSLSRLATDHVDVYYLHAPDYQTPIEETVDALAELVAQGKVRHLGVSNFASWQVLEILGLCEARGLPGPCISQVMYNLLIRQLDLEYWRFTRRYRVHSTIYNPLAGGLLTGQYQPGAAIVPGSRFDKNKMYQKRYWSPRTFELVERYRALAEAEGLGLLELAYAWTAGSPGVDSILIGPASVAHLDDALAACEKVLSPAVYEKARAIHEDFQGTDASYAR